jgi:hypothetical protein
MNEKAQQLVIDYRETFNGSHGKRVLEDLRRHSKIDGYLNIMGNKEIKPYHIAFAEGQRSVLIHIYTKLEKDPYEVKQERAINEGRN